MTLVQNFPFAAIMMCLAGGVTCAVLRPKAAAALGTLLNAAIAVMMAAVLRYTLAAGGSYRYMMGHFPAPWGNEIRIGPLEALMALMFSGRISPPERIAPGVPSGMMLSIPFAPV